MIEAYPLAWPVGWKRTLYHNRRTSSYKVDFVKAREDLAKGINLLGAVKNTIVISSNVPTRRDGLPLASFRQPTDPGVACYWTVRKDGQLVDRVIACDGWRSVRENLRAIGLSIDALRMLERTGASEILDRAFTGFQALPPASSSAPSTWRVVFGLGPYERPSRDWIELRFRELALTRHPDKGGSDAEFIELTAAREAALREAL